MNNTLTSLPPTGANQPHVAIITSAALKTGYAIYYSATYAQAERALRLWFAVFAAEQSIIDELPDVGSDEPDAAPDPAIADLSTLEEWAELWIAEGTTLRILPIEATNPLRQLLQDLPDDARPRYEAAVKVAVARIAPELVN